ncbi:MAG: hypothetical protein RLZZ385_898 [Pseudomonadota bacterium]
MSKFFKPLIITALLLGLIGAVIALLGSYADLELAALWHNPALVPALVAQIVIAWLLIEVWRVLLRKQLNLEIGPFEATGHLGITVLGKYIPGKVWGIVGRAMLLDRRGIDLNGVSQVLILEQVLTLASGVAVSAVLLGFLWLEAWGFAILAMAGIALPLLLRIYSRLTLPFYRLISRRLAAQSRTSPGITTPKLHTTGFYQAFLVYVAYWLLTGAAMGLLLYPYLADDWLRHTVLITAALPTAVLAGFFALWAPGGIGVREGIVVGLLSLQLPLDIAALTALSFRVICILSDLSIGAIAVTYFARHPGLMPGTAET